MIAEYDSIQKLNSIKDPYAQVNIGTQPQANFFQIPLRNDKGHRDMKYHINTKENVLYRHILMRIGILMIAGFEMPVKTLNCSN